MTLKANLKPCSGNTPGHHHPISFELKHKLIKLKRKIMATIFWGNKDVPLVDYLPPKTTITGDYYCKILARLRISIKQKRRGLLSQGYCFCITMLQPTGRLLHSRPFVTVVSFSLATLPTVQTWHLVTITHI